MTNGGMFAEVAKHSFLFLPLPVLKLLLDKGLRPHTSVTPFSWPEPGRDGNSVRPAMAGGKAGYEEGEENKQKGCLWVDDRDSPCQAEQAP